MRRTAMLLTLGLLALGSSGCKSLKERLTTSLQDQIESDSTSAFQICGYPVQGLTGVTVANVTNTGSSSSGSGTALVSGTPVPMAGMPVAGPCTGTISFLYNTTRTTSTCPVLPAQTAS